MTINDYDKAKAAYEKAMNAYYIALEKANEKDIDCSGKPASFCKP